ncbi:geranylgeranyl pyrophosphate synthase [Actinoplanes italicus]|uniref:Geranylgeranyl diphosphate synthase type I n=1 Tax=Actinoplanes italicus TaxID=113567 RepID=A0A2T0KHV7_9ACTN|nr:polyprenyl synthetase family protein [Actinoplanes italicus]PRX23024.1 geranylgeranyl diphosphate synthase type I [Actinoplanes italicus]GIE28543.1 geranylgeranyl pyrophosphate synthase [Actinoplanes italicus]
MTVEMSSPPGTDDAHSPLEIEGLRSRIDAVITGFQATQAGVLADVSPESAPLVRYVSDLMNRGKRLRPAFCYWAWRAAGADDDPALVAAAAALEFLQAAALIHDDVMDLSDTRRGAPAVHRRFATLHSGNGWTGDSAHFGVSAAVLAGDLCFAWSDELYTGSGLPAASLIRGRRIFNTMRTQLMGGQYLDLVEQAIAESRHEDALHRARRVVRYKSAKYTVEHPLLLGGLLADADDTLLADFSAYGLPLGEAFQLRDDVLGVFGDPQRTGKPAGDDLREGKRTALIALTYERASAAQIERIETLFGDRSLDAAGVGVLREIIADTGALAAVEAMIGGLLERSLAVLDTMNVDESSRSVFAALASAATDRVT